MNAGSEERAEGGAAGSGAQTGLPEALRAAVEKTFAATAEPRGRAQDLLEDLSRLGQDTREDLARRGHGAREASAGAAARLVEAAERLRVAGREELRALEARADGLENELKRLQERVSELESKPEAEG